ncbi:hypothetical protein SAZ10_16275 [Mesorhizobium sp. BAC0120]|nr:hypothetical protein [Mesorhizobium sp. BAC0120]MDW6023315.1 hypothetical protein [Mesorhizobium sp. BAC0120]
MTQYDFLGGWAGHSDRNAVKEFVRPIETVSPKTVRHSATAS